MVSHVKAPCRIDLSGGTLDLWPIYTFFPEGLRLNHMAIELYAHAHVTFDPGGKFQLTIESRDMRSKRRHSSRASLKKSLRRSIKDNPLRWVERVCDHFFSKWALDTGSWKIVTWSEVPPGSGLGGSSTLGVALASAIADAAGRADSIRLDPWGFQQTLRDLEGIEIEHPAGDQDYVPAIFGGLLTFSLGVGRREVSKLEARRADDVASRMALIYTGKPHHSGINNWQVYKDFISKKARVKTALEDIHKVSWKMADALVKKDSKTWVKGVGEEWVARQRLGKSVNAPVLQRASKWAKSLGAVSTKACGAGGGGCLLVVFSDSKHRDRAMLEQPGSKEWCWMKVSCAQKGVLDVL
jgi:D-glycero-alpha-D-manno-heptose-7-phosphate kinase